MTLNILKNMLTTVRGIMAQVTIKSDEKATNIEA